MKIKKKIAFAVPQKLQDDLRERVIKDKYGLRGKSQWISEAIEEILKGEKFYDLVNYNCEMQGFDKIETVVLDYKLNMQLEDAVFTVREHYPILKGPKSGIIRTAIIQRIIRK